MSNRPSPIPPIHPDTITFERALGALPMGGRISYRDLAAMVRKDLDKQESSIKSHISSAERRLRNGRQMEFTRYYDETTGEDGRERLDDKGIVNKALRKVGMQNRAAGRIQVIGACVNMDAIDEDTRIELSAAMLAARGSQKFTSRKSTAKLRGLVRNSTEHIPMADAFKLID